MPPITNRLLALRDERYAAFIAKLIPNLPPDVVVGVRAPQVARLARELRGTPHAEAFMADLPHRYLEENGLHAALLERVEDFEVALREVERFLPYINNWATCDTLAPRIFGKHKAQLLPHVRRWMAAEHEYTCRFGIGMLMRHYLDDDWFSPEHLDWVVGIDRQEYYVRMMQAWYLATALAKQGVPTEPYMHTGRTPEWVRRKAIQKAIESYRVPDDLKVHLRTLRQTKS